MKTIPELVDRLVEMNDGNAMLAARQLGSSTASLSRYRSGNARPRKSLEEWMRLLVENGENAIQFATIGREESRLRQLEDAIAGTLNALREEFHRTATISKRQDVLDLVAALVFAHVTSIDSGGLGLGKHLKSDGRPSAESLNSFMADALMRSLPEMGGPGPDRGRFYAPLKATDERFAEALLEIFERDGSAFQKLHEAGRDDLINEVFSRFMSASFVDEKEMGQYLTPPEVTRFMVQVGFHALTTKVRTLLLNADCCEEAGILLDPSCGVGSFLAESIRYFHAKVRERTPSRSSEWLNRFVTHNVVGIDKSERMLRLACINLGLFGARRANLFLANSLSREGADANVTTPIEGTAQLILTNPPFGATYSGRDISAFAIGRDRSRVDSEILFLERYLDWAAPGGVIVSVVPDSVLVNRGTFAQLRTLLRNRCHLEAVFSLPSMTFAAAGTSTKTSVIVLRRNEIRVSDKTFFGEVREVGYSVITRSGQRRRVRHAKSDLPALLLEFIGERPCQRGRWGTLPADADRWDAGFHSEPDVSQESFVGTGGETLLVSDIAELIDNRRDPRRSEEAEFDYIEISDVDGRTGLVGHKRLPVGEAPSRARKLVQTNDILVSTVRPERGTVSVVPPHLDGAICSTGFAVLRCREDVHPVALAWLLKGEAVRRQMIRHNIGIAYPVIAEQTCLSLTLPTNRTNLKALSEAAFDLEQAQAAFEASRQHMMQLIAMYSGGSLGEVPNLIEGSAPSAVPDSA